MYIPQQQRRRRRALQGTMFQPSLRYTQRLMAVCLEKFVWEWCFSFL
jgi:hypothetical protein